MHTHTHTLQTGHKTDPALSVVAERIELIKLRRKALLNEEKALDMVRKALGDTSSSDVSA